MGAGVTRVGVSVEVSVTRDGGCRVGGYCVGVCCPHAVATVKCNHYCGFGRPYSSAADCFTNTCTINYNGCQFNQM